MVPNCSRNAFANSPVIIGCNKGAGWGRSIDLAEPRFTSRHKDSKESAALRAGQFVCASEKKVRFCQYRIEWNYFSANRGDSAVADRTLFFGRGLVQSADTLQVAPQASLDRVKVLHLPRLLSDNGPSYVSSELSKWLENIGHIRGRAY